MSTFAHRSRWISRLWLVTCLLVLALILGASEIAAAQTKSPATAPAQKYGEKGATYELGDWPHWLGPNYNASSDEKGLLCKWPDGGPKVLWRAPIKMGWGCPAIQGKDLYLGWTEPGNRNETYACLNAETGKEVWTKTVQTKAYWEHGIGWASGGVRSTPCITDKYVYTVGVTGFVICWDRKTGKEVWRRTITDDYICGGEKGRCTSIQYSSGKLVYYVGLTRLSKNKDDENYKKWQWLCLGLDPETGKTDWEWKRIPTPGVHFSEGQTPVITKFNGDACALLMADGCLFAVRSSDGKELWRYVDNQKKADGMTCMSTVIFGNRIVWPAGIWTYLLDIDTAKPETAKTIFTEVELCGMQNYVEHDGYLYGHSGEIHGVSLDAASNSKMKLLCRDLKTGKKMWETPQDHRMGISMMTADGLLFIREYQTLILAEATPKAFTVLSKMEGIHNYTETAGNVNKDCPILCDLTMPVLSHGRLYLRTGTELICLDVADHSKEKAPK